MADQYPPSKKAEVLALWQLGTPKAKIARDLNVSRAYVQQVTRSQDSQVVLSSEKQEDVGEVFYDLLIALTRGATSIARQFEDRAWLEKQSADGLAISLGVAIDKLAGLLAAISRGQSPALPGPDREG